MKYKYFSKTAIIALAAFFICTTCTVWAEEDAGSAQANNPLANITAFNMHNYFIGEVTESDEYANQFWFRFAKPFSISRTSWLLRASLPVNSFPIAPDDERKNGFGDLNLFAAYLVDTVNPAISFGVGPQLTLPTATDRALGSEKWSAGVVNVLFDARSAKFQYGYLLSWQHSFVGEDSRDDVHVGALQPFAFYQLGRGTYLRAAPIWTYDIEHSDYSVPIGVGIGKVLKQGKTVYNFFIEPQVSIIDSGPGLPEWQIFMGLNLQFLD